MIKKITLFSLCLMLFTLSSAQLLVLPTTAVSKNVIDELTEIEKNYEMIRTDTSLSNVERSTKIVNCSDKFKEYIDKCCSKIIEKLDDEDKINMVNSQKKWNEFIIENNKLNESVVKVKYDSGSTGSIALARLEYEEYRTRAYELKEKCDSMNITITD